MHRLTIALCMVAIVAGAPAGRAAAEPSYFLIAGGDVPERPSALGPDGLRWTPDSLAVRADGVMAFATGPRGEVFWVQGGRLTRLLAEGARERSVDVAFAADGSLLYATCGFA